ncbi:pseudouridine synthase, partial [Escherichia coli]|nr:pseudouridine synthase [Escherichia coli]
KPKGVISSVSDPEGRKKVTDLVQGFGKLYPVGRLDFNSEGLIILTNDGDLTNRLTAAKTVQKTYYVKVKGVPSDVAIRKIARGIRLPDGFKTAPAEIRQLKLT